MSKFTGPLNVSFSDARSARLQEDLIWEADELGSGRIIVVPKGFTSDGASVPRLLWWFLPPWGDKSTRAAILHDYLRTMISRGTPVDGIERWAQADWQFFLALRALKVNVVKALLAWLGVRAYSVFAVLTNRTT
jgi:hypothetical protein